MEQGKIVEAERPTVRVGATPTELTAPPPAQPPKVFLQAGCPSCRPTNSIKALKAKKSYNKSTTNPQLIAQVEFGLYCIEYMTRGLLHR